MKNYFVDIYESIFKPNSYPKRIKYSFGKVFLYLFIISLICSIFLLGKGIYEFNAGMDMVTTTFEENSPNFEFKNNKLEIKSDNLPIIIEEDDTFIYIDTVNEVPRELLDGHRNAILISEDRMISKEGVQIKEIQFKDFEDLEFNKEDVLDILPVLKSASILIFIFGFIFTIIAKILNVLILTVISLIYASSKKSKLQFGELFKLSVYGLTLSMFISMILSLFHITIPLFTLIYYGVGAAYVITAIKLIQKENSIQQTTEEKIIEEKQEIKE